MESAVWFGLIGLLTGLLANTLLKGGRFGILGDISVGMLGALIGGFLLQYAQGNGEGLLRPLLGAAGGAALLVFDMRLLQQSFAQRLRPVLFWGHSPPGSRKTLFGPRQPETPIEPRDVHGPEAPGGAVPLAAPYSGRKPVAFVINNLVSHL
ncbi:MAG: hypothetical protein Q8S17_14685 [Humidesulfovibrio sp.]|nr:hypothetical protein [Humidesulfovibrio sp.]